MKKSFSWLCSVFLALTIFFSITALPSYAQQTSRNSRIGHLIQVPPAQDIARQKAAQLKQLQQSQSPSHSQIPAATDYVNVPTWAGYVAGSGSGSGFKGVTATWNAPCVSGTNNATTSYGSWVGLGGAFGQGVFANSNGVEPLEQTGIALQTDGTYRLFWEYVSSSSNQPPFFDTADVIRCGQSISAWVYAGTTYCSNGGFYAHVQDNATGAHLGSTCLTESSGLGLESSEWIDERPTNGNGCATALTDFNFTNWSNVFTQPNASGALWANPANFINRLLIMHSGIGIAYPDGVDVASDNTFVDRWYDHGIYCD